LILAKFGQDQGSNIKTPTAEVAQSPSPSAFLFAGTFLADRFVRNPRLFFDGSNDAIKGVP